MPFLARLPVRIKLQSVVTGWLLLCPVLLVPGLQAALPGAGQDGVSAQSTTGQTSPEPSEAGQTPQPAPPPQPGQVTPPAGEPPSAARAAAQAVTNLPNTMSAPPFTVADKFDYRVVQTFGFRGAFGAAVAASIGQASGTPKEWGGGVQGYAERLGSAFGGNLTRQTFAFLLETGLHEDPRYFPSEDKGFKSRTLNAIKQVVACKTDAGHSSFAYGRVISSFGAAQFVNIWQPASNGTVDDGLVRGFYGLGADFAYNMLQEFLPFTRPHSIRRRSSLRNP